MKKKLVCTLLTCVMILGCFAGIVAQAGSTTKVVVADAEAAAGATVTLNVALDNASLEANTLGITVSYDSSFLTLKSGSWKLVGDFGDGHMKSFNKTTNQGVFCVGGVDNDGEPVDAFDFNTTIFSVSFTVSADAKPEDTSDVKFDVIIKDDSTVLATPTATAKVTVPHVHVYDQKAANQGTLASAATCLVPANYYYTCKCGAKGTTTFAGTELGSHKLTKHNAVTADHTKAGNIEYSVCGVCNKVFNAQMTEITMADTVIPQVPHKFSDSYLNDTTKHWKVCECGAVDAVGQHQMGEWQTVTAAAEGVEGLKTRTCTVCGYAENEKINALGHNVEGQDYEHDETNHWKVCTGCQEKVDVTAHRYGDWTETVKPTADKEGTKVRVCADCGYEQSESVPPCDNPSTGDIALIAVVVVAAVALFGTAVVIGKKKAHN